MSDTLDCVIERLYETVCRDPETGEGGLDPVPSEFHADGFRRIDNVRMAEAVRSSNDRLVEIDYLGTSKYQQFANGTGSSRRGEYRVLMRIGYFAGDNHATTNMIIGGDDRKIGIFLQKLDNIAGTCADLCLQKVTVSGSEVIKLDPQRYELQISLLLQVQ